MYTLHRNTKQLFRWYYWCCYRRSCVRIRSHIFYRASEKCLETFATATNKRWDLACRKHYTLYHNRSTLFLITSWSIKPEQLITYNIQNIHITIFREQLQLRLIIHIHLKMNPLHGNVDWDSVTVIKKRAAPVTNKKTAINKAIQQGETVDLQKKYNAGANKHHGTSLNTAKLDAETEKLSHNKVGLDTGRLIQQMRAAKNWKREEFATKICEKVQVVTDYENGSAIPNNQIFSKMERALGVKLRGKDRGTPLAPPAPKAKATTSSAGGSKKK